MTEDRSSFATVAGAWERNADWIAGLSAPVQRWLIDHLDPQPGETILELGAGPGDTGFDAARRVAPEGRLISTDLAPEMIEAAKRRAASAGIDNVDFRMLDAQSIDLDDTSVDCIVHRYGPMLLPDPARSFARAYSVLRSGGRYAAATFAEPGSNPWLTTMVMSITSSGVEMPADSNPFGPQGPFSLADPDSLRSKVGSAGFADVIVEAVEAAWDFTDADDAWEKMSTLAGATAVLIAGLDEAKRDEIKRNYTSTLDPYADGGGYRVPGKALCVFGRKQ